MLTFSRTIPPAVPGVVFLSGGQVSVNGQLQVFLDLTNYISAVHGVIFLLDIFIFIEDNDHIHHEHHDNDNGQSESEASANLCAINQFKEAPKPWR